MPKRCRNQPRHKKRTHRGRVKAHVFKPMSDAEVFSLAERIYKNEVFTDRHVRNPADLRMVFMVTMFMEPKLAKKMLPNTGMIWAPMSDAAPAGVNGYPCFFSASFVGKPDAKRVWAKYEEIKASMEKLKAA